MHVLAVEFPMLVDVPLRTVIPSLTGCDEPEEFTEPVMAKAILVPFTAVWGGNENEYGRRGLQFMLDNSPFVRVDRVVTWHKVFWNINQTSVIQPNHKEYTKGVTTAESESFSHTVGVSISAEGGAAFLGTGGKISATVTYQFGYQTQHSVSEFVSETTSVGIDILPGMAAAAWAKHSEIAVWLHNQGTGQLEWIDSLPMNDSASYVTDDYPNCATPDAEPPLEE
jgi:insecticidal crystal toxin P42 protein